MGDFVRVEEVVALYERPCGCDEIALHPNYIPHGCMYFARTPMWHDMDLFECRLCGAVWTQLDAKPESDRWWQEQFGIEPRKD